LQRTLGSNKDAKYDVIDGAPTAPVDVDPNSDLDDTERDIIGRLQNEVAELRAQNESLEAKKTIDDIKGDLMEPLLKRVYNLVACYCGFILFLALLQGFEFCGFSLDITTLGILCGSTAVSVIGLIGMLISGVFSPTKN